MQSTRAQNSTKPQMIDSSLATQQMTAQSQVMADRYTNSTARSANAAPQASNQLSSSSHQPLELSKQVSCSSNDPSGALSKGQQPTSSNKNFNSYVSKNSGLAVHEPNMAHSVSKKNNSGGPLTLQVPSSSGASNRASQAQAASDPGSSSIDNPNLIQGKGEPNMNQLEVEPTSPKTYTVQLPSSQKSQMSNREPVKQHHMQNQQQNPVSMRDLQKINIHDFQTQQELPSSTQNRIINKKRKTGDGNPESASASFSNNTKHTQSMHEDFGYNQNINNYESVNGQCAPNDLKQLGNNNRSRQHQQDSNSNHTASSSIIKHAKSLYQFIVPVAQLNLNVNSNASNAPNQVDGGHNQQTMNEGQNNGIQQTINTFIQQPDQQHQLQNQEFVLDRAEIAMQQQRLPRSQAQGAGQGRFAGLGGRQINGHEAFMGGNGDKDHHYQQMRERSSNNPRLIGSLGGPTANTIHRRDFSSNTHNSGSGQQQFNTFNRTQHDRSAGQFAQIDSLTNYEPSQSIFSGHGGHPAVSTSSIMNNPPPRFGGLTNSFHVPPFNDGLNYLNNQSYNHGLFLGEPQQSISSQQPGGKQNIFATQNLQRTTAGDAYDSRSHLVNQSADQYMDQMQKTSYSVGLNHHQARGGARELSNPVRMSERDGMGQLPGKPCRTQRDHPMPVGHNLVTNRSQMQIEPGHLEGLVSGGEEQTATLKAVVHYVKINIPQSIRMQVQGVFLQQTSVDQQSKNAHKDKSMTTNSTKAGGTDQQQVVMTKNKCRIDSVQTVQQTGAGDAEAKEVTIKKANFHDQELKVQVKMNAATQKIQQKLTLKLLAVNNEQTKLIGLLHYTFMPNFEDFKKLDNALLKFQRAIDNDACVCISTHLIPNKAPTPSADYGSKLGQRNPQVHLQPPQPANAQNSKNQTYDTMSQLVGNDGYFQRPIRKFQKNSADIRNVDFSKADDMGMETREGEADDVDEGEADGEGSFQNNNSNHVASPQDSKEGQSTVSQHRAGHIQHIESNKKLNVGINFIQNSSAKMKLPPAAPAKTPKDRAKVNSSIQDIVGAGPSHVAKGPQSHSSSFVTDQKLPFKDYKEDNSKNVFIAPDDDGDERSVTMTTFHNGNALVDGAFKEEEHEPGLSQSINLNNVLNQTSNQLTQQVVLQSSQDTDHKAAPMIIDNRDASPQTNHNRTNQNWPQDQAISGGVKPHTDLENYQDNVGKKMLAGKVNDFDLSKVDGDDAAPSDSEQQYNRNSISNSPTRNRKPIQNSQPKTNLQVDFAHVRATDPKMNTNHSTLVNHNPNFNQVQTPNRQFNNNLGYDSQKKRDNSQDVRSTLKSTFNILYNKLQVGVITTINNALEERSNNGGQHMNSRQQMINGVGGPFMKRSQSSQAPFIRDRNNFNHEVQNPRIMNGQHEYQDFEAPLNFDNHTQHHLRQKNFQHQQNSALPPAHHPRRTFQSPVGPPPPGMPRDAKLASKFQNINQQNLNNEVVILRQEKSFLSQRLKQQEDQHALQVESLKDKIEAQEKRVEKRDQRVQRLLDDITAAIPEKIKDINDDDYQSPERNSNNKKDYLYEKILALFQRQNNVIQMMTDRMKIMDETTKETKEQNSALQVELDALKEKVESESKAKQDEQAAYQEQQEAQKFKMTVQIEQIEALTKEKMENDELIKVQDRLVVEQESKIKELEKQMRELREQKEEVAKQHEGKAKDMEKHKREVESLQLKLEQRAKDVGDLEDDRMIYKESEEQLKRQIKTLNDNNLQNEKIQFKLKHDIDSHLNTIEKLKKEIAQLKQEREEMMEHNREVAETLKLTEFQLIQAKSSWAESECEREQLFNRVQELEDRFDSTSKKSYQSRKE